FSTRTPTTAISTLSLHDALPIFEEAGFPERALVADSSFHDAVVDAVLDRAPALGVARELRPRALAAAVRASLRDLLDAGIDPAQDRKSTRLNSSHVAISYAVFCL